MRKFFLISILFYTAVLSAQVITSLGNQNLKIPMVPKEENQRENLKQPIDVTIDTTSVYYALVDSAATHIEKEEWNEAGIFLRQAINSEPDNPNNSLLLSNLATIQRLQGQYDEAIKNYTLALDITPNAVTLLHNRAALYLDMGKVELAKTDYERIIDLDKTDLDSRYNHGLISMDEGDVNQAISDFDAIRRINPKSPLSSQGLATLYKALGELDKAIEFYSEAITINKSATLLANRADCYLAVNKLNEAEDDIRNALQLDSEDGFIYLLRAKLNKLRFEYNDMNRDIQLAISHGVEPNVAKALLQLD